MNEWQLRNIYTYLVLLDSILLSIALFFLFKRKTLTSSWISKKLTMNQSYKLWIFIINQYVMSFVLRRGSVAYVLGKKKVWFFKKHRRAATTEDPLEKLVNIKSIRHSLIIYQQVDWDCRWKREKEKRSGSLNYKVKVHKSDEIVSARLSVFNVIDPFRWLVM